ncbi:hypothetical protein [Sporolactobacillus inulinus]|jgi:hypothetical protein|uniref:Uncharacterized protein n=2 Tax=Sporolactobacillus inulinus TaxID=2078 RepID=A0A4Y3T3R9_9BACL|nr:hypothetical protein [Sporolactobacillus inulinus]KLI03816.1 hypothetical protein SINU_00700 [Sporolactobacillus inulinus CASD]GAY76021.1 hypothetical protein NBRC111894_1575 [Sporolactobacillus inulinus]GEB76103.1 hypothetical protein SIN01_04480 [Sporolactobacillus inulinus]
MNRKWSVPFRSWIINSLICVLAALVITFMGKLIHFKINAIGFLMILSATALGLFLVYQNKIQFKYFFHGKQRRALSAKQTFCIIAVIVLLIILAPLI